MHNLMRAPQVAVWYPAFKIIPILLILSVIFLGNKASRAFSIYAGIAYLFFNILQNFSVTSEYGLGILTQNLGTMFLISLCWFWEAYAGKNDLMPAKPTWMKIFVILLALLAFWDPIDPVTHGMDFDPVLLMNNAGGLAFCMMTPVFLAVLIYFYPKVNLALLRVNSLAGAIIGIFNVMVVFADPAVYWWFGVLHIPLFVLSVYGMRLGWRTGSS
jgi:fumarate reductase subunit D